MEQIKTTIRKWGNSFGVVIPKEIINREGLSEGSETFVSIQPKKFTTAGDIFGILKRKSKKSTQKILDEIDREFEPEG